MFAPSFVYMHTQLRLMLLAVPAIFLFDLSTIRTSLVSHLCPLQSSHAGPLADLTDHLSNPFGANWASNIGQCVTPMTSNVQGITIPLTCLWPANH